MDPDNREAFWLEYYRKAGWPEERRERDLGERLEEYIRLHENVIRTKFTSVLQELLSASFDRVAVIFKHLEYGSLNIGLDLIVGAVAAAGFTTDDLLSLLMQFTPEALERSWPDPGVGTIVSVVDGGIRMVNDPTASEGQPITTPAGGPQAIPGPAAAPAPTSATETVQPLSRLSRAWWIANTSLVLTALVLAGAALLVFLSTQDDKRIMLEANKEDRSKFTQALIAERDQLTKAMLQRQTDLQASEQKLLDSYEAQAKDFQQHLATEAKHIQELGQVEIELLRGSLGRKQTERTTRWSHSADSATSSGRGKKTSVAGALNGLLGPPGAGETSVASRHDAGIRNCRLHRRQVMRVPTPAPGQARPACAAGYEERAVIDDDVAVFAARLRAGRRYGFKARARPTDTEFASVKAGSPQIVDRAAGVAA
jgi:hypothetical protein